MNTTESIARLETLAKLYAAARQLVAARVTHFNDEHSSLQRRCVPGIKTAANDAADLQAQLVAAIQANPELFKKPRTMTLHGIKLGFQKGKGAIEWADDEKVVEKIAHLMPDDFRLLVKVTRKPIAKALQTLDVATLRKLGCTVEETGDAVFVKATDSEVDKLVARILKEGAVEEAEAKAA